MGRRSKTRIGLLGIALAAAAAISPASAPGATVANGSFTAAPGERNHLSVYYDPTANSYLFLERQSAGFAITDGDGAGGCSVLPPGFSYPLPGHPQSGPGWTCPASVVSQISISLGDGDDEVSLTGGNESSPFPNLPLVTPPATIDGGDGNDRVRAGAGADLITGGAGNDSLGGFGGDDTLLGGEGNDGFGSAGGSCYLGGPLAGCTSANAGADRLDGGPGDDRTIIGWEGADGGSPDDWGPDRQETDAIICGPGSDGVLNGLTDEVGIDCEELLAFPSLGCQAGGVCSGEITVEASAPAGGSAGTSAKGGGKGRKITLAREKFRLSGHSVSGLGEGTPLKLNGKALRRVLRGRRRASAQIVVRVEKRKGKKSAVGLRAAKKRKLKTTSRTRFLFTKG